MDKIEIEERDQSQSQTSVQASISEEKNDIIKSVINQAPDNQINQSYTAQVAAERERQFIGDILADENSDYDQETPSPKTVITQKQGNNKISPPTDKIAPTFGLLADRQNEATLLRSLASPETPTSIDKKQISQYEENKDGLDYFKPKAVQIEEQTHRIQLNTHDSGALKPSSMKFTSQIGFLEAEQNAHVPFMGSKKMLDESVSNIIQDDISPFMEVANTAQNLNYDYATTTNVQENILPFTNQYQSTKPVIKVSSRRLLNQNQLLDETSSNGSQSSHPQIQDQQIAPSLNIMEQKFSMGSANNEDQDNLVKENQSINFDDMKCKIFQQLTHNKKLQQLVSHDKQDSFKDILSDMINETLNETQQSGNSRGSGDPRKNHSSDYTPANSSLEQINSFANTIPQDIQKSSNILDTSGNAEKSSQEHSQTSMKDTESELKPPSIGRESPSENNIYGTKDYFDYYTRLKPNLRDPKLPKPTYYDVMNPQQNTNRSMNIEQQSLNAQTEQNLNQSLPSNSSNYSFGNKGQERFQSNFGHLGLINQMASNSSPSSEKNHKKAVISPTHLLVNDLINKIASQKQQIQINQSIRSVNQSLNSSYQSHNSIKIEEQQDHTHPQNQQEDSFHSQVQEHEVSFGSIGSFPLNANENLNTSLNNTDTQNDGQQQNKGRKGSEVSVYNSNQQQLQQQFMMLQMQHSQLNSQLYQTHQEMQLKQNQNAGKKQNNWSKYQQLGQRIQLVQIQMQQMMIYMQQQQQQPQLNQSQTQQIDFKQDVDQIQQLAIENNSQKQNQIPLKENTDKLDVKKESSNILNVANEKPLETLVVGTSALSQFSQPFNIIDKLMTPQKNEEEVQSPVKQKLLEPEMNLPDSISPRVQKKPDQVKQEIVDNSPEFQKLIIIDEDSLSHGTTPNDIETPIEPKDYQKDETLKQSPTKVEEPKFEIRQPVTSLINKNGFNPKNNNVQASQIKRSEFLEKLIESMQNQSPINYRILRGHVFECAVDQFGSRYIQQTLNETQEEESKMVDPYLQEELSEEHLKNQPFKDLVFHECLYQSHTLINDVFGNYVIQKLIEYGSSKQKAAIVEQILGDMVKLTRSKYGCRVIQKAIEHSESLQRNLLVSELRNQNVLDLIKDQNANHVIQKCLAFLSSDQAQFITKRVIQKIDVLCIHTYGCRVIQKILCIATYKEQKQILKYILDEKYFPDLIVDQFGNYLIQNILEVSQSKAACKNIENPTPEDAPIKTSEKIDKLYAESRLQIYQLIEGKILEYSCHKFASNVVEKCMEGGTYQQMEQVVKEILNETNQSSEEKQVDTPEMQQELNDTSNRRLCIMISDKFANYVIQKSIDMMQIKIKAETPDSLDSSLFDLLLMKIQKLESMHDQVDSMGQPIQQFYNNYAKHVFELVNKKLQIQPNNYVGAAMMKNGQNPMKAQYEENKYQESRNKNSHPQNANVDNFGYNRGYKFNKNKYKNDKGPKFQHPKRNMNSANNLTQFGQMQDFGNQSMNFDNRQDPNNSQYNYGVQQPQPQMHMQNEQVNSNQQYQYQNQNYQAPRNNKGYNQTQQNNFQQQESQQYNQYYHQQNQQQQQQNQAQMVQQPQPSHHSPYQSVSPLRIDQGLVPSNQHVQQPTQAAIPPHQLHQQQAQSVQMQQNNQAQYVMQEQQQYNQQYNINANSQYSNSQHYNNQNNLINNSHYNEQQNNNAGQQQSQLNQNGFITQRTPPSQQLNQQYNNNRQTGAFNRGGYNNYPYDPNSVRQNRNHHSNGNYNQYNNHGRGNQNNNRKGLRGRPRDFGQE